MGNKPSNSIATGNSLPSIAGCLGGENFQAKIDMLKETPLGKVLSLTELSYFSKFFSIETLSSHCRTPMVAGELLVVGEGEVQVYVIQSGIDIRTREQRFVLCTKRKGDLIWVPTVTRLAKQKSNMEESSSTSQNTVIAAGETPIDEDVGRFNTTDATMETTTALRTGKHKDLYTIVDTTYIDSLYGAVLLKLDRRKYGDLTAGNMDLGSGETHTSLDLSALRRVLECNMEDYLRKVSLFQHIPPAKLAVLGEMCNYEFINAGSRVCAEGEAGNEIFIVLDGRLDVYTGSTGSDLPLASLGSGDYFGELAALIRMKRIATVISTEDTLLACIKRHDFRSFLTIMPDVRTAMDKVVKEHLIYKFTKICHPFFPWPRSPSSGFPLLNTLSILSASSLSPAELKERRAAFYDLCEVEDVDADRILLYEHDNPGVIYFVSEGQVRLVRQEDDGTSTDVVLGAGSILGARAAVLHVPQLYTIVTDQVCIMLKLSPTAILQHFADHPEIKAGLEVLFKRRGTPLATLLQNPEAYDAFAMHLREEFTAEHLAFYDDALAFQTLMKACPKAELGVNSDDNCGKTVSVASAKLDHIQKTYFALDAPFQLNIPDLQRQRFLRAFEDKSIDANSGLELERLARLATLLEEIKCEVLALLERDNYSRFKNTKAFAELLGKLASQLRTEPALSSQSEKDNIF